MSFNIGDTVKDFGFIDFIGITTSDERMNYYLLVDRKNKITFSHAFMLLEYASKNNRTLLNEKTVRLNKFG